MNKTLVLLLLALVSFAAVPQTPSLAEHLASAAYAQRAAFGLGSQLRMDEATPANADSQSDTGPAPAKVVLIGMVVVCFIAIRRLS